MLLEISLLFIFLQQPPKPPKVSRPPQSTPGPRLVLDLWFLIQTSDQLRPQGGYWYLCLCLTNCLINCLISWLRSIRSQISCSLCCNPITLG